MMMLTDRKYLRNAWYMLCYGFALVVIALSMTSARAESTSQDPQQLIQGISDQLLKHLLDVKKSKHAPAADYYFKLTEVVIAPSVDFELIAKRVMARAYNDATPAQRQRFTQVFRNSLLTTYSKAIANYAEQTITMLPFSGIQTQGARERASIKMDIRAKTGDVVSIVYALYKDDQNIWKLENITLGGVNLGLTFRNQFQDLLKTSKGDIDQATLLWQQTTH